MGSSFAKEEYMIEDIIEEIELSKWFKKYKTRFFKLSPPRYLYLIEGELVIETLVSKPYAIERMTFDWFHPNIKQRVCDYVERQYDNFVSKDKNNIGFYHKQK